MVGAGIIAALHTGVFAVWVTAISSKLINIATFISIFGLIMILLNTAGWWKSRQVFNDLLKEDPEEKEFELKISLALMVPFFIIIICWGFSLVYLLLDWYMNEIAFQKIATIS